MGDEHGTAPRSLVPVLHSLSLPKIRIGYFIKGITKQSNYKSVSLSKASNSQTYAPSVSNVDVILDVIEDSAILNYPRNYLM